MAQSYPVDTVVAPMERTIVCGVEYYTEDFNNSMFTVPTRYRDLSIIGTGAYGTVCSAYDQLSKAKVAIKKLHSPFQSDIHSRRAYREIMLLKHFKHDNIIQLFGLFTPSSDSSSDFDVYIVTDLMGADLASVIKYQQLSDEHVQFLVYQILRGLKYLHSANISHRDLKPSNIAVNADCELKILDFGLARIKHAEMTGYVATRWYRAPEIMLCWMHYTEKADIFSVGCIMAEMLTGRPLFPGADPIDLLNRITDLVGSPSQDFIDKMTSEKAKTYMQNQPKKEPRKLSAVFPGANLIATDLLEKMLMLDPDKRISAVEALSHPYLQQYADITDEPSAEHVFDYDEPQMDISGWKQCVFSEITKIGRIGPNPPNHVVH